MANIERLLTIGNKIIGLDHPTYFIADIAANHDGELGRAQELIHRAAAAGADAAKFQHFQARTIVSDRGFKSLGGQHSHQSKWKKSVFAVYESASLNLEWTPVLKETCDRVGIAFLTSPYAFDLVDHVDPFVPAYKIGSGDITWTAMIDYIAGKGKPYFLATGASSMDEVDRAVRVGLARNPHLGLMQCNTNYTASLENFRYIQLNVLKTFQAMYPEMVLGLSDHTPGHTTVLGAVALGARVIEKHFTDDTRREGPDHGFSMDPMTWREMVGRVREMESSLGNGIKKVEENERQTVILQRRSIRLKSSLRSGDTITRENIECLRPCPEDALPPYAVEEILDRKLRHDLPGGECLRWTDLI